jgi:hypothetical protein
MSPREREILVAKSRALCKHNVAIQIRELLDDTKYKYGARNWAEDEAESMIADLVFEEDENVAQLRKRATREELKFDAALRIRTFLDSVKGRYGKAWTELEVERIVLSGDEYEDEELAAILAEIEPPLRDILREARRAYGATDWDENELENDVLELVF